MRHARRGQPVACPALHRRLTALRVRRDENQPRCGPVRGHEQHPPSYALSDHPSRTPPPLSLARSSPAPSTAVWTGTLLQPLKQLHLLWRHGRPQPLQVRGEAGEVRGAARLTPEAVRLKVARADGRDGKALAAANNAKWAAHITCIEGGGRGGGEERRKTSREWRERRVSACHRTQAQRAGTRTRRGEVGEPRPTTASRRVAQRPVSRASTARRRRRGGQWRGVGCQNSCVTGR